MIVTASCGEMTEEIDKAQEEDAAGEIGLRGGDEAGAGGLGVVVGGVEEAEGVYGPPLFVPKFW